MMNFETFALIWPAIIIPLVVASALLLIWLGERSKRRKAR
jgi:hypothetical protein